jgi:hypothetical protein
VFEHEDPVAGGNGNGAPGSAFADDDRDQRRAEIEAGLGRAGNGFGLTAFFRAHARIGSGSVDQGDHRKLEPVGHLHDANGLAITFRAGRSRSCGGFGSWCRGPSPGR